MNEQMTRFFCQKLFVLGLSLLLLVQYLPGESAFQEVASMPVLCVKCQEGWCPLKAGKCDCAHHTFSTKGASPNGPGPAEADLGDRKTQAPSLPIIRGCGGPGDEAGPLMYTLDRFLVRASISGAVLRNGRVISHRHAVSLAPGVPSDILYPPWSLS